MSNRPVLSQAIFGLPATGAGTAIITIIIGSRAFGALRREWVCFGRRDGGAGETVLTCLVRVTGDRPSVFTGVLITVLATPETAIGADAGGETSSRRTRLW